ncbi:MAG: hypothetical protein EPN72_01770 [Nevskiaceae bacterium]|nr:MAG: hypothetical protein EPN63_12520 [Nevskiaceae bacterium]TBR74765.1 MAG: hypothetical protein EPN72_01770 [Nevskiaceae bacterium]
MTPAEPGEAPRRFNSLAMPALLAGVLWLCASDDIGGLLFAFVPGVILLGSGVSLLLWPGAARITQMMALGGVVGVVSAVPELLFSGFGFAAVVGGLSLVAFFCAGRAALQLASRPDSVPAAPGDWKTAGKAAIDEALMGYFAGTAQVPAGARANALCTRVERLERLLETVPWADPRMFNAEPPPPDDARLEAVKAGGMDGRRLHFTSGYVPPVGMPDVPHWLEDRRNAQASALVFRRPQAGRPWLIGIHGYRMGGDWLNTRMLPPRLMSARFDYNLVLPVLPLHGPRTVGWRSGDHYLDGALLDLVFAQAQALWDLRRTVAWIRAEDPAARIGVMGFSLGGYNAALLAAYADSLDFCVAGIPLAEPVALLWDALPQPLRSYFTGRGIEPARINKVMKLVSPLALPPRLPRERLAIFAGTADRVVPPDQPIRLSRHWDVPVQWYAGGHLTFRGESVVLGSLRTVAAAAGWRDTP